MGGSGWRGYSFIVQVLNINKRRKWGKKKKKKRKKNQFGDGTICSLEAPDPLRSTISFNCVWFFVPGGISEPPSVGQPIILPKWF